jgi:hypothetical protein
MNRFKNFLLHAGTIWDSKANIRLLSGIGITRMSLSESDSATVLRARVGPAGHSRQCLSNH